MRIPRRLLTTTSAAAMTIAGLVVGIQPAEASSRCPGTMLKEWSLKSSGGFKQGYVQLWYSSANGGTNCVMTFDNIAGSHSMLAWLRAPGGRQDRDEDVYTTYAGGLGNPGAYLTNMDGKCVDWGGQVSVNSVPYTRTREDDFCN